MKPCHVRSKLDWLLAWQCHAWLCTDLAVELLTPLARRGSMVHWQDPHPTPGPSAHEATGPLELGAGTGPSSRQANGAALNGRLSGTSPGAEPSSQTDPWVHTNGYAHANSHAHANGHAHAASHSAQPVLGNGRAQGPTSASSSEPGPGRQVSLAGGSEAETAQHYGHAAQDSADGSEQALHALAARQDGRSRAPSVSTLSSKSEPAGASGAATHWLLSGQGRLMLRTAGRRRCQCWWSRSRLASQLAAVAGPGC